MAMKQEGGRSTVHQNVSTLEQTYILCVEPQTQKLFKVNIGNQEAEEVKLANE